jgi:O-antigen ligase
MSVSDYSAQVANGNSNPARTLIFSGTLVLVWLSTAPFKGSNAADFAVSNVVNQIAFTASAIICLAAAASSPKPVVKALLRPSWIILVLWMMIGVAASDNFDVSLRAFLFLMVVMVLIGAAALIPADVHQFRRNLAVVTLVVLVVNYAGLMLLPDVSIHSAADLVEPEHAGSWRGSFDHKNLAGSMMAIFAFVGLFVFRSGGRLAGLAIMLLAGSFLLNTGSKTAIGMAPLAVIISLGCMAASGLGARIVLVLGSLALMLTFTLGTVIFAWAHEILQWVSPGQTFTGRVEIWSFAVNRLSLRPWLGFGLEGFWSSDAVRFAEIGEYETGISSGMPHGHNSFLDAAVHLGVIGFLLTLIVVVILPLRDYHRSRCYAENRSAADLMLQIWLFCLYSACLESFFFRRADPVWCSLLLAMVYLRLLACFRVRSCPGAS